MSTFDALREATEAVRAATMMPIQRYVGAGYVGAGYVVQHDVVVAVAPAQFDALMLAIDNVLEWHNDFEQDALEKTL